MHAQIRLLSRRAGKWPLSGSPQIHYTRGPVCFDVVHQQVCQIHGRKMVHGHRDLPVLLREIFWGQEHTCNSQLACGTLAKAANMLRGRCIPMGMVKGRIKPLFGGLGSCLRGCCSRGAWHMLAAPAEAHEY